MIYLQVYLQLGSQVTQYSLRFPLTGAKFSRRCQEISYKAPENFGLTPYNSTEYYY